MLVVSCTNENCKETMVRKDLDEHVTVTCQWRIIHCSYCGVSLSDYHLKVKSYIICALNVFTIISFHKVVGQLLWIFVEAVGFHPLYPYGRKLKYIAFN